MNIERNETSYVLSYSLSLSIFVFVLKAQTGFSSVFFLFLFLSIVCLTQMMKINGLNAYSVSRPTTCDLDVLNIFFGSKSTTNFKSCFSSLLFLLDWLIDSFGFIVLSLFWKENLQRARKIVICLFCLFACLLILCV